MDTTQLAATAAIEQRAAADIILGGAEARLGEVAPTPGMRGIKAAPGPPAEAANPKEPFAWSY